MTHLVYHDLSSGSGKFSPFDEAVLKVCGSGAVGIVSPYIGVDYLQRIIQISGAWRLVSDVEAWLASLSGRARPKAWQFIRENLNSIHHCPALHAKAVITRRLAMFGSANLTMTGILGRTEMGILIDEPKMVSELNEWFETLWQQTNPPIADEANAFVQWLDDEAMRSPTRREKFSLSASGMKIRASLVKLPSRAIFEGNTKIINLVEVAQELIIKEQQHYVSLNETVESAINEFADEGFIFREIVVNVFQSLPVSTYREIYFSLLQNCANHVRSVFAANTRNRLILHHGKFTQSSKELISQALIPFDTYLTLLIHYFDFDVSKSMLDEDALNGLTWITAQKHGFLIDELLDCGFLELEDMPGRLPQYNLSEAFEWSGRYKLFAQAMQEWRIKLTLTSRRAERLKSMPPRNRNREVFSDSQNLSAVHFDDDGNEPFLSLERISLADFLRSESTKEAIATREENDHLARERQIRHDSIDKVQAHLLMILLSGNKLPSHEEMRIELPIKLHVDQKLVRQLLRGRTENLLKAIVTRNNTVSINPKINWEDLADYPLTQRVCKTFLKI